MFFMSCSVPALFTITVEIEAHFNRQHFSNLLLLNFGEFSPTHTSWATTYVSCSPSFLFLADRRGPQCGLWLLYSTCFNYWLVLCSEKVFWYLGCKQCLFKLLFPLYHLKPVWTHSSDINKHFCPKHFCSWNIFSVFYYSLWAQEMVVQEKFQCITEPEGLRLTPLAPTCDLLI